jgi:hypothetical protein
MKQTKFQVGSMVCNSYEEAIAYFKFMHKLTGVILGIVEIK